MEWRNKRESDTKEIFTIETKNRSINVISKANILCTLFIVEAQANNNKLLIKSDREKVIEVVERSYVNGAFNMLDTDAMKKGFHQEFAIFTPDGEEIKKYPIKNWINNTIKTKKRKI